MNKWLSPLVAFLAVCGVQAQQLREAPKLVITIVVDQLREDYLYNFSPYFGEKGFKRLMNEGLVFHRVEPGLPSPGKAASTATIYTGSYPCYHGIVADKKYDFDSKREVSIIRDETYLGNYTTERLSPLSLYCSTVGDELKIASEGRSDVFAIAPSAEEAILAAGRYADGAFWLDDYNGKWATTTYYRNIPWYIERHNTTQAGALGAERIWTPSAAYYNSFPYAKYTEPFKHTLSRSDNDRFLKLKQTPFINQEVTNLAANFFEYADFGKRAYPSLLALTYYAGDYFYKSDKSGYSVEVLDTYYCLDKEIERIIELADKKVGLKNVLIVLTSSGYYNYPTTLPDGFKPFGEFYPSRCTALLNMYLMAIYGQENWVKGYYNRQIYLDKELIENQKIDPDEIIRKAAEFVAQFSGVQDVTTAGQWMVDDTGRSADFRRGMHKKLSGELFIELQPGWIVVDEDQSIKKRDSNHQPILAPLFLFGHTSVRKGDVYRPVKVTEIAPTLSHILRIRAPNGSNEFPLQELVN